MNGIVLFGAGSLICADVAETCRRNGQPIAAAIRNVPGAVHVDESVRVLDVADISSSIIALPFLLPLFKPDSRRAALAAASDCGFQDAARLVDRTSVVASDCRIEVGVYINAGCVVGSGSTFQRFAFCNRGANIGHHCQIGAFASIGPGAVLTGLVTVGDDSLIGAGAIILPKVSIGSAAIVGAGAVVTRNVPDGALVVGNPARIVGRPAAR